MTPVTFAYYLIKIAINKIDFKKMLCHYIASSTQKQLDNIT